MFRVYPFSHTLSVEMIGDFSLPPSVNEEVNALWGEALKVNPHLFDGPMLTVISIHGPHIRTAQAAYRHLVASRRSADMAKALGLRPLAISGILACPQGIALGLRGDAVAHGGGYWELVPSGLVEPTRDGSPPDLSAQLCRELKEEVGLDQDHVSTSEPIGMIDNTVTGVLDVIIPLSTRLQESQILSAHAIAGTNEYSSLKVVPKANLDSGDRSLLPESRAIIYAWLRTKP